MDKVFLHASIRVIQRPDHELDSLTDLITTLLPLDFSKEKIKLEDSPFIDAQDVKRHVLQVHLDKQRHIKVLLKELFTKVNITYILSTLDSRVDEDCEFFLRLDLTQLLLGKYIMTDKGNCVHFTFSIATYPKSRDIALEVVKNYLKAQNNTISQGEK